MSLVFLQIAVNMLESLVDSGVEFPEAISAVLAEKSFKGVSQEELTKAYDARSATVNPAVHQIAHLTKREYFAAMTMQGLIHAWDDLVADGMPAESIAIQAVELADALIAELAK
jgi:hypothetical protein